MSMVSRSQHISRKRPVQQPPEAGFSYLNGPECEVQPGRHAKIPERRFHRQSRLADDKK
jgi:hypothetical protein